MVDAYKRDIFLFVSQVKEDFARGDIILSEGEYIVALFKDIKSDKGTNLKTDISNYIAMC